MKLSASQQNHMQAAVEELRKAFPGRRDESLVEMFVAATIKLPDYSTLEQAQIAKIATSEHGASTLCYGIDPRTHKMALVLIRRAQNDEEGLPQYGYPGGFINVGHFTKDADGDFVAHRGEEPRAGAIRENQEELLDGLGKPLLALTADRLELFDTGFDESRLAKGRFPVHYTIYTVALRDDEMARLANHSERLKQDPDYKEAVFHHSHGEIKGVELFPVEDVSSLGLKQFTYAHSYRAVQAVAATLREKQSVVPSSIRRLGSLGHPAL